MLQHAIVVGAGIVGLLSAWELLKNGWKVTLLEKQSPGDYRKGTSFAAAGMMVPYTELESAEDLIFTMGLKSLSLWPEILVRLPSKVYYTHRGGLILCHARDRPHFDHVTQRITRSVDPSCYAWIQAGALEPELEHFSRALYLPHEANLDNQRLLPALIEYVQCHPHGDVFFGESVQELYPFRVMMKKGSMTADVVIDCRGMGAMNDFTDLRPVRGEAFLVRAPEVSLKRPVRLIHPRFSIYIAPREQGHYYIGATAIETRQSGPVKVRSALELLSAAYSVHPSFGEAEILATYTGQRPAFPDHLPRLVVQPGLLRINGLYRHGYLLGPVVAQILGAYLHHREIFLGRELLHQVA
jgi:glycine oxidase